jgi:predicted double-glycine peptidase
MGRRNPHARPPSAACAVLLALGACVLAPCSAGAASSASALPVRSLMQLRNDRVVRQHWDLSCGAAVVATLFTYQLGAPVTEREAALGMLRMGDVRLVRARLGFSLLDLKRFAASRGFEAAGFGDLSLDELVAMAPAVAPIRVFGFGHFVVVRGRVGDRLLLADPAFGDRTMTTAAFLKAWPSRIGFVIHPRGQPHPPNRMGVPPELVLVAQPQAVRAADAAVRSGPRAGGAQ